MKTLFPVHDLTRSNDAELYKKDFQTPSNVCKHMAGMLPPGIKTVLEPTPGEGNLVRALIDYDVTAPDDFFLLDPAARFDAIVMNPPFSAATAFMQNAPTDIKAPGMKLGYYILQECMQRTDTVIALMPWFTLIDSDTRQRGLKKFGLVSITALPRKTFEYTRIQTVILHLHRGWRQETTFKIFQSHKNH